MTALGGLTMAGLMPSSCFLAQSSCPEDSRPARQTACFTKSELEASKHMGSGGDGSGGDGSGGEAGGSNTGLQACPGSSEILSYPIGNEKVGGGASIEPVQENGESCCYVYYYPCEGRPLLAAEEPIVAKTLDRSDWTAAEFDRTSALDETMRTALAEAWAREAAFEHASIASFSRFLMDLLSLGAPLELVREAERAIQDEIVHAELCYGLASRFAGKKLGPGPLPVPAFAVRSLREVALATLSEGCISETIAAHAARLRLAGASDPTVVAALERIVEDEQRHAELAFRFLAWAIERDPALARDAERAFANAIPAPEQDEIEPAVPADVLRAHGLLTRASRRSSAERALRHVIAPCHEVLRARLGGGSDLVRVLPIG